jgi:glutamate racemase
MLGIFDTGFGGLSVLKPIHERLPELSTIYLGDNARAPYGERSREEIFRYTLEGVRYLFAQDCPLVILACNTASAEALKWIQREILPNEFPNRRVLGVIRPTAEHLNERYSGDIGIFATPATVRSEAYINELNKFNHNQRVGQVACPGLTDLVESGDHTGPEADYLVKQYIDEMMEKNPRVEQILLACTHYPILYDLFRKRTPDWVKVLTQGYIVADKLKDYLMRHPGLSSRICREEKHLYYTTSEDNVSPLASMFYEDDVEFEKVTI